MVIRDLKIAASTANSPEQSITIGMAMTPAEKQEIYHFRYQVYVEEMSKYIEGVDHNNKLLYDDLDDWSLLLYAKIGSKLIATVRISIGFLADFPEKIATNFSLHKFQKYFAENDDHKLAYCSKLMIAPYHRSSPVLYLLLAKCYELGYHDHVEFAFLACNFYLLRLYEQTGFHRYCKNFVDAGYGLLTPLAFAVNDTPYLRMIRSPLLRIARKMGAAHTQAVDWFREEITEYSHTINSQVIQEDELWSILCKSLDSLPTSVITILRELSIAEAKKFLHCCAIFVQCEPGDLITNQGDTSYAYNILITGRLKSLTFQRPIKYYALPGQHFGANGLTEHTKHNEDIIAIDSSEIVVLSGMAFQKFFNSHQEIAHKIIQSLRTESKIRRLSI